MRFKARPELWLPQQPDIIGRMLETKELNYAVLSWGRS
jgi:hypothetical protein